MEVVVFSNYDLSGESIQLQIQRYKSYCLLVRVTDGGLMSR